SHSLVAFDVQVEAVAEKMRTSLGREPRAVLVSGDGARVLVTHAVEDFISVVPALGHDGAVETRGTGNHAACGVGSHCSSTRIARNAQAIVRVGERGAV